MSAFIVAGAYKGGKYAYRRLKARRKCKNVKGKSKKKACIRRAMK